jgi:hypothetical protein
MQSKSWNLGLLIKSGNKYHPIKLLDELHSPFSTSLAIYKYKLYMQNLDELVSNNEQLNNDPVWSLATFKKQCFSRTRTRWPPKTLRNLVQGSTSRLIIETAIVLEILHLWIITETPNWYTVFTTCVRQPILSVNYTKTQYIMFLGTSWNLIIWN